MAVYKSRKIPTVTLEKCILHYFLTSKVILQGRFQSSTEKWFTSDSRLDLYKMIAKFFESSRSLMTETQLEFLVNSSFPEDEARRQKIFVEFKEVLSLKPQDEAPIIIQRLNEALRCQEVEELIMSAYSSIESGDVEEALSKLKQGSLDLRKVDEDSRIVSLWEESDDWVQEVNNRRDFPEKYAGIPTGFKKFDDKTGGLFPAELTVIFGLSGKGKSTLMKQIGVNVRKQGYNVAHFGNEEDLFQMRTKYTSVETGIKYSHWKRGTWTDEEMEKWREYKESQLKPLPDGRPAGKMFIHNFPQQTDATMIERKLSELKSQGIRIDLVIVDYLDLMSSIKRAYNENDEGGRVTGDLKQIAINFHVPVLVCTQANTTAERQEVRDRPFLTAADVFGTKRKVHSANTLVGIVNQTATVGAGEREDQDIHTHRLVICVPKNRDGGVFTFRLINHVETGQIEEDDGTDQAGQDMEAAAQVVLNEAANLEEEERRRLSPTDEKREQEALNRSLTESVEEMLNSIPTSEGTTEQVEEKHSEESSIETEKDNDWMLEDNLPDSSFFDDDENGDGHDQGDETKDETSEGEDEEESQDQEAPKTTNLSCLRGLGRKKKDD